MLDTHVWIWSQAAPEKLSRKVARSLENEANEVWLSPVSVWELALLVQKRRVALDCDVREWVAKAVAPLTAEIVLETMRFSLPHPDPADRFLVATARTLGLTLVTSDGRLLSSKAVPTCRTGDLEVRSGVWCAKILCAVRGFPAAGRPECRVASLQALCRLVPCPGCGVRSLMAGPSS